MGMKAVIPASAVSTEIALQQKTELTVKAVDTLVMAGVESMTIFGMPIKDLVPPQFLSIGAILPQRNKHNTRRFLHSLNAIMTTVLDDHVEFPEYVEVLAREIATIQAIAEEEKGE